jgi:hypothetical protein
MLCNPSSSCVYLESVLGYTALHVSTAVFLYTAVFGKDTKTQQNALLQTEIKCCEQIQ